MNEIPLKEWLVVESIRLQISPEGVRRRWKRGRYPTLKVRAINCHVKMVRVPEGMR